MSDEQTREKFSSELSAFVKELAAEYIVAGTYLPMELGENILTNIGGVWEEIGFFMGGIFLEVFAV